MALVPPFFLNETPEDIFNRIAADLPVPSGGGEWNIRAGSILHALLMPAALEVSRARSYAYDLLENGFLKYAQGTALDDKALEYGLYRRSATNSTVVITVYGDVGTVISPGDRFATEGNASLDASGVEFQVTGGPYSIEVGDTFVNVVAESTEVGAFTNVDEGAIALIVDAPAGVTSVTNLAPADGGQDTESDDALRARSLQRAQLLPASGNKATYIALTSEFPGVEEISVQDLWRGAGTGKIVIGRTNKVFATPSTVDSIQAVIDPSIMHLAHFETPEAWQGSAHTINTATPLEGGGSLLLTGTTSATVTAYLEKTLNLSFWDAPTDTIEFAIRLQSAAGTTSGLSLILEDNAAVTATATATGASIDALGEGVLSFARSAFSVGGGFSWGNIVKITFSLTSTGTGGAVVTLDSLRIISTAGGHGDGYAPIGIQVTVVSAKATYIDVTASIYTEAGVQLSDISSNLEAAITQALLDIPPQEHVVRISRIANVIHDTEGVIDYSGIQIARAGGAVAPNNIVLDPAERARIGAIVLNVGV